MIVSARFGRESGSIVADSIQSLENIAENIAEDIGFFVVGYIYMPVLKMSEKKKE